MRINRKKFGEKINFDLLLLTKRGLLLLCEKREHRSGNVNAVCLLFLDQRAEERLGWTALVGAEEESLAKVAELLLAQIAVLVDVHGVEDLIDDRLVGDVQALEVVAEFGFGDAAILVGIDRVEDGRQSVLDDLSLGSVGNDLLDMLNELLASDLAVTVNIGRLEVCLPN